MSEKPKVQEIQIIYHATTRWPLSAGVARTANKIPLTIAGFFIDQSGPPKQHLIPEGIAPICAKLINLGLRVMSLMFKVNPI